MQRKAEKTETLKNVRERLGFPFPDNAALF